METALILRGRLSDSRTIELDEPVPGVIGAVEVVLRPITAPEQAASEDVFDLIAAAAPGTRSKEEIDEQIADERGSWGDR